MSSRCRGGLCLRSLTVLLVLGLWVGVAAGQSESGETLYFIPDHWSEQFNTYPVDPNGCATTLQTTPFQCQNDPAGIAVWEDRDPVTQFLKGAYLFVTGEFTTVVEVFDVMSFTSLGCVSTGAQELAGIGMDRKNLVLYSIARESNALWAFDWNPTTKVLSIKPGFPKTLPTVASAFGLSVDSGKGIIYVADTGSGYVRGFDINAAYAQVFSWAPTSVPVDVDIDENRNILYTTHPDGYCASGQPGGTDFACMYDIDTATETVGPDGARGGIGVSASERTGYIYMTYGCDGNGVRIWRTDVTPWVEVCAPLPAPDPAGIAVGLFGPPGNPRAYLGTDVDTCAAKGSTVTVNVACVYKDKGGTPPATNVNLIVKLPAVLNFVSATGSYVRPAPRAVVWHIGMMQVGDSVFHQIVTKVNNLAVQGDKYFVSAEVLTGIPPTSADVVLADFDICIRTNDPPVALCKNVEVPADENCLADASIDSASYDPNGDPITLTQSPPGPYSLGDTQVMLIVYDGELADTCYATVTVIDVTPPEISVELSRDVLWPPNHKMVDIRADVTVTDNCCASPSFKLVSITSNEPDNGKGDGNTIGDIQGADPGTPDAAFQLRSERSGGGDGRIYTIVYEAQDCEGNGATATVIVRVPHDQSGMALASTGYTADGTGFDPSMTGFAIVIPSTPTQFGVDAKGHSVVVAAAFDAMALDPARIYVGNTAGAIKPVGSLRVDNNNDGLADLALFYSTADAGAIVFNSAVLMEDQKLEKDASHGPVGLHYTDNGGVDYLVRNIFELGPSTPLGLHAAKRDPYNQDVISREDRDTQVPGARVNALLPAYPNPFNPSTTIPFELATAGRVSLQIFDTQGRLVRTLYDEEMPVGAHQAVWNGRDNSGSQVATGVYFVRFATGSDQVTRKLVMIK